METTDPVDIAAEAWMASLAMFSVTQPLGFYRMGTHGTSELVTGAPMSLLNGVINIDREPDAAEIAAFSTSPKLASVAWSIQVRGDEPGPGVERTAAEHGLTKRTTLPFMLKNLTAADAQLPATDAPPVRGLTGTEGELYQTVMAAGYEGPREIFAVFSSPAVLDHSAMRGYVAEVDGVPVATSFGVVVDDHVGVFNIAVPPEHRRRGYGRAATAQVLREAYAAGARIAFLHASPMGVGLYRDMGFRVAENWTIFTS
ncbi:GNAT family N-acetyltransferase [Micromonospora sp. NPDC049523]|uniref:GNAT family N-acetyltransferase n=1 Tax=Micromonospora sp. NPDC049523 TaxID=3155921 RepID=UPI00342FE1B7